MSLQESSRAASTEPDQATKEAAAQARAALLEQLATVFGDQRLFSALLDIRTKSGTVIPFAFERWHPEQRAFEAARTGRDVVLKPRQIGFTTLELARDLRYACVHRGVNVAIVAHDRELAEQVFLGLKIMAEGLRRRGILPTVRYDSIRELVFSRIGSAIRVFESGATVASAQKKGRSGTIHRLHVTELAFWQQPHETMAALLGCVPEGGEVVIESTPNGVGGLFYDVVLDAHDARGPYKFHFFPWYEHPEYHAAVPVVFDPGPRNAWEEQLRAKGCSDAQIAWWRSKVDDPSIGLEKALQEWPIDARSCFRARGRQFLDPDVVDRAAEHIRDPIRRVPLIWRTGASLGELLIFEEPRPGEEYVVGGDTAEGVGADGHSATVLERKSGLVAATLWSDSIEPGDFGLALALIGKMFNSAVVAPERNNHGHASIRALEREALYEPIFRHTDDKPGWRTDAATRPPLWDELARAVREGVAWTPDGAAHWEWRTLVIDDDGKPRALNKGAPKGCRDDRWVSHAIAWQVRSKPLWVPRGFRIGGL